MEIRAATKEDWDGIWPIWHAVVAAGETYLWAPETGFEAAREAWMLPAPAEVFVVTEPTDPRRSDPGRGAGPDPAPDPEPDPDSGSGRERVVGTALLAPNKPGLGDHVANAGFMVDPAAHGRGIGRALAAHVLAAASARGYRAMQFNAVVSTNTGAVRLWRSLGFSVIGTVPGGFRHARHGLVDLLIMYRRLDPPD